MIGFVGLSKFYCRTQVQYRVSVGSTNIWSPCGALPCVLAACARASDATRRCMAGRASAPRTMGSWLSRREHFFPGLLGRKMAAALPFLLKTTPVRSVHS